MIKKQVAPQEVVDFLNEALKLDKNCIETLFNYGVDCNESIVNHPTIQCGKYGDMKNPRLRFVGLLNGIFGVDENGYGCIAMSLDDETNKLQKFIILEDRLKGE